MISEVRGVEMNMELVATIKKGSKRHNQCEIIAAPAISMTVEKSSRFSASSMMTCRWSLFVSCMQSIEVTKSQMPRSVYG